MLTKTAIIRQLSPNEYRLYSKKKDDSGKRRNLGTFRSRDAAKEHEKDVQFFKSHADDALADDRETKMLTDLSDIAGFLEEAGFVEESGQISKVMNLIDGSLE